MVIPVETRGFHIFSYRETDSTPKRYDKEAANFKIPGNDVYCKRTSCMIVRFRLCTDGVTVTSLRNDTKCVSYPLGNEVLPLTFLLVKECRTVYERYKNFTVSMKTFRC